MLHQTTFFFTEISFKATELISILPTPPPSTAIYPHTIHELVEWVPMQSQRWASEVDTVTCLGWHKATSGTDFHSQCLCYGTSPRGTTALRQQAPTEWSWHHWLKHKPFPSVLALPQHQPGWGASGNLGKAWIEIIRICFGKLHSFPDLSRATSLPARLHTPLGPGRHFSALMATQWVVLVVLNSNTQQQHTDYKPWGRSVSSQSIANSNI